MEEIIVRAFIAPHRRSRWMLSIASTTKRSKFLDCLNHCQDFDPRYVRSIAATGDSLVSLLRALGAPKTCYVVSAIAAIDGEELPLAEAIAVAESAGWGTIISCVTGRLAYYIDEAGTDRRFLLIRDGSE